MSSAIQSIRESSLPNFYNDSSDTISPCILISKKKMAVGAGDLFSNLNAFDLSIFQKYV